MMKGKGVNVFHHFLTKEFNCSGQFVNDFPKGLSWLNQAKKVIKTVSVFVEKA